MLPYHNERPLADVEVPSLDKESVKTLPPALRQLADHNPRGGLEGEALPARRKRKAILLGPDFVKEPLFRASPKKPASPRSRGGDTFKYSMHPSKADNTGDDDNAVSRHAVDDRDAAAFAAAEHHAPQEPSSKDRPDDGAQTVLCPLLASFPKSTCKIPRIPIPCSTPTPLVLLVDRRMRALSRLPTLPKLRRAVVTCTWHLPGPAALICVAPRRCTAAFPLPSGQRYGRRPFGGVIAVTRLTTVCGAALLGAGGSPCSSGQHT